MYIVVAVLVLCLAHAQLAEASPFGKVAVTPNAISHELLKRGDIASVTCGGEEAPTRTYTPDDITNAYNQLQEYAVKPQNERPYAPKGRNGRNYFPHILRGGDPAEEKILKSPPCSCAKSSDERWFEYPLDQSQNGQEVATPWTPGTPGPHAGLDRIVAKAQVQSDGLSVPAVSGTFQYCCALTHDGAPTNGKFVLCQNVGSCSDDDSDGLRPRAASCSLPPPSSSSYLISSSAVPSSSYASFSSFLPSTSIGPSISIIPVSASASAVASCSAGVDINGVKRAVNC